LISPAYWETILQQWRVVRAAEQPLEPPPAEPPPLPASAAPEALAPHTQQQAEELLGHVVELPDVRTAFLLNPAGKVLAWKGPDTQESLQRLAESRSELAAPFPAQAFDAGSPGLNVYVTLARPPRPPKQAAPHAPDAHPLLAYHGSGWRLVVFCREAPSDQRLEEAHRRIRVIWEALARLLIHQGQD
jgi:hypothetical protein